MNLGATVGVCLAILVATSVALRVSKPAGTPPLAAEPLPAEPAPPDTPRRECVHYFLHIWINGILHLIPQMICTPVKEAQK